MALSKEVTVRVTILDNGTLEVRRSTFIVDDGTRFAVGHQGVAYTPDTPLAQLPAGRIRRIAQSEWTPEVIAAFKAQAQQAQQGIRALFSGAREPTQAAPPARKTPRRERRPPAKAARSRR